MKESILHRLRLRSAVAKIGLLYLSLSTFWILASDQLLGAVVPDAELLTGLQTVKGLLFITATAVFVALLVDRHWRAQRRMEGELAEAYRQLETLMSNLDGMVYRCRNDEHWTMELVSEGSQALTGYGADEWMRGRTPGFAELIHPEDRARVRQEVDQAVATGKPFVFEYRLRGADGEERWVWEKGRAVPTPEGEPRFLEGFITDVTERRKLEEQLRKVQKLYALGRFAAEISHDFNNVLTAIAGYAGLLEAELDREGPDLRKVRDRSVRIRASVDRASALTRQLLAFGRRQPGERRQIDLNETVRGLEAFLERLLPAPVELETASSPSPLPVEADPVHLEQVLMNLVLNARDAMPEGGRIVVRTSSAELDAQSASDDVELEPGHYALLSVEDTGIGMDEATRRRIFEPFFTTKPEGQGTGLGLASAHGLVRQHGGSIRVHSRPGEGSRFEVYLPALLESAWSEPAAASARPETTHGAGKVLVIEDQAELRELAEMVLETSGCEVLSAASREEALSLADREGLRLDVVLSDMVMPGMSAPELTRRLRELQPQAKILYMSGYGSSADAHGVDGFLAKPFTPSQLVNAALDAVERARGARAGS